jgi:hypothetical protein
MIMKIDYSNLAKFIEDQVGDFGPKKLTLDQYCYLNPDADFALIDACLQLGQLSPDEINMIGDAKAPPSCWHTFVILSDLGKSFFEAGLKISKEHKSDLGAPPLVVKLRGVIDGGKSAYPEVDDLKLIHKLAEKYSVLGVKELEGMKDITGKLRRNGFMTPPQAAWIKRLILKVHEKKVSGKNPEEASAIKRLFDWAN